jgi:hypothetical protein
MTVTALERLIENLEQAERDIAEVMAGLPATDAGFVCGFNPNPASCQRYLREALASARDYQRGRK